MKIYIDFDDVICETAKYFTKIAKELFNIDVPYREVLFFNLQKSFDLSGEQYDELMKVGHIPENLLDYEETPGASEVINKWVDEGHEVFVVTGRNHCRSFCKRKHDLGTSGKTRNVQTDEQKRTGRVDR